MVLRIGFLFSKSTLYKMFQLRRKLMNLMDNQYQGRDGIMDEASNDKDQEDVSRFEFVL